MSKGKSNLVKFLKSQYNTGRKDFNYLDNIFAEVQKVFPNAVPGEKHTYFIFENAIMDFKIKDIPEWMFRIWTVYEAGVAVDFLLLGEIIDNIDKFKPGRVPVNTDSIEEFAHIVNTIRSDRDAAKVASYSMESYILYDYVKYTYENYKVKILPDDAEGDNVYTMGFQEVVNAEGNWVRDTSITREDFIKKILTELSTGRRKRQQVFQVGQRFLLEELPKRLLAIPGVHFVGLHDMGNLCTPRYNLHVSMHPKYAKLADSNYQNAYWDAYDEIKKVVDWYNDNIPYINDDDLRYNVWMLDVHMPNVFCSDKKGIRCKYKFYKKDPMVNHLEHAKYRGCMVNRAIRLGCYRVYA